MEGVPSEKWLRRLMERLKCNVCGHRYQRDEIAVLANKDDLWFFRLFCPHCSSSGLVAAVVDSPRPASDDLTPAERERFGRLSSLSMDDVLDMHNWLKEFDGDFAQLFSSSASGNA